MSSRGCIISLLVVSSLVAVAGWNLRPSIIYDRIVKTDSMPDSDQELESWLQQYPFIAAHTVTVERSENQIRVVFIQNRNLFGFPAFPPLENKCRDLGYDLGGREFRHNYQED